MKIFRRKPFGTRHTFAISLRGNRRDRDRERAQARDLPSDPPWMSFPSSPLPLCHSLAVEPPVRSAMDARPPDLPLEEVLPPIVDISPLIFE
ncbi:hypothetical protein L1887_01031 [Cichorium endivia]|nr:hypothetical protein L1887_01031 [Cichorium endivia]